MRTSADRGTLEGQKHRWKQACRTGAIIVGLVVLCLSIAAIGCNEQFSNGGRLPEIVSFRANPPINIGDPVSYTFEVKNATKIVLTEAGNTIKEISGTPATYIGVATGAAAWALDTGYNDTLNAVLEASNEQGIVRKTATLSDSAMLNQATRNSTNSPGASQGGAYNPNSCCGVMRYTPEQRRAEEEVLKSMPLAPIDKDILKQLESSKTGTSFSLLPDISYIAAERDQGLCGNCWVWSSTGVLEVALDVQRGIKNRLSIQYVNSTYNGGTGQSWACWGGNPIDFVNHYGQVLHQVIPWSNTNAGWYDGSCDYCSSTAMLASSISTTPNYPICSIGPVEQIPTWGVGQSAAIGSIKYILQNQKQAVLFLMYWPTGTQVNNFKTFWNSNQEDAIWAYNIANYGCNYAWDSNGCGHGVLCVGWDDTDAANPYWIMLNSWGTAGGNRPNGLFRVPMNYNYDCVDADGQHNIWWLSIPVVFCRPCTSMFCHHCLTENEAVTQGYTSKCDARPCGLAPDNITLKYCYYKLPVNPVPSIPALRIDYLITSSMHVTPGEQAVLSWSITGVGDAFLTCGEERRSVPLTGSMAVTPTQSGCCTLTISNQDGIDQKTVCITVVPPKVPAPVINSFTATCPQPSPAARTPGTCTLSWSVTGPAGTTVTITGIGSVDLSGANQVPLGGTYTLTATNSGGSATRTVQAK